MSKAAPGTFQAAMIISLLHRCETCPVINAVFLGDPDAGIIAAPCAVAGSSCSSISGSPACGTAFRAGGCAPARTARGASGTAHIGARSAGAFRAGVHGAAFYPGAGIIGSGITHWRAICGRCI
jgi:hypothetical protein